MAFWQRKSGNRVFVYCWDSVSARQKVLPRSLTRELDEKNDETIDRWVKEWSEVQQVKTDETALKPITQTQILRDVENFCLYLKEEWQRHRYSPTQPCVVCPAVLCIRAELSRFVGSQSNVAFAGILVTF